MPTDGLEQYYDYDVRDDSEIEKELKHKRNDKIITSTACTSLISSVLSIITGSTSKCLQNEPLAIITFVLIGIMIVSGLVCICFDDDIHC